MKKYVLKTDENGNEITVADVHKVLLEMLKMIDGICQKYNIPYFLNGGSALGAIRHQDVYKRQDWESPVPSAVQPLRY